MGEIHLLVYLAVFVPSFVDLEDCPNEFESNGDFCYLINANPEESCPYKENLPLWSYIGSDIFIEDPDFLVMDAKRYDGNGSIKIAEIGLYYENYIVNKLISTWNEKQVTKEDNRSKSVKQRTIGNQDVFGCRFQSKDCSYVDLLKHKKACFYKNEQTICQAFDNICQVTIGVECYCHTDILDNFFCRQSCDPDVPKHPKCDKCDHYFQEYGTPSIGLTVVASKLFLRITNYLKLKFPTADHPVTCYGDSVYTAFRLYTIKDGTFDYPFKFIHLTTISKQALYEIKSTTDLTPGRYWCKGFAYPDLKVINSNIATIEPSRFEYTFVVSINFRALTSPFEDLEVEVAKNITVPKDFTGRITPVKVETVSSYTVVTVHINGKYEIMLNNLEKAQMYFDGIIENKLSPLRSINYCFKTQIENNASSNLTWNVTPVGKTISQTEICLDGTNKLVSRTCNPDPISGAYWGKERGKCSFENEPSTTEDLENLLESNMTSQDLSESMRNILDNPQNGIRPEDVFLLAQIIDKIANLNDSYEIQVLMDCVSKIMDLCKDTLRMSHATDSILSSVDKAMTSYANLFVETEVKVFTKNLDMTLINIENQYTAGLAFYEDSRIVNLQEGQSLEGLERNGLEFAVLFKNDLLQQILNKTVSRNNTCIVSAIFKNTALFNSEANSDFRIAGLVPSVFATGFDSQVLSEPLHIAIKPHRNYRYDSYCSFWKYNRDLHVGTQGYWAKDHKLYKMGDLDVCKFDHMTHFSILLELPTDDTLDIVCIVGSSISILCILGIYLTALLSRTWRESESAKISLSSCTTIVIQLVFLFVADTIDSYDQESLCVVVGVILHYSVISQFCWMLIIGILQYRKFVIVFTGTKKYIFLKCSIVGWILPIIPVACAIGFFYESYISDQFCYISSTGLYWCLILPVSLIILINIIIFLRIFYEFGSRKKSGTYGKMHSQYYLYVKLSIFLFFLLGFTWIFGLLNVLFKHIVLSYLFSICASFQGVVLFWYHIVLNHEAIYVWKKFLRQFPVIGASDVQSNSTSVTKIF